MSGSAVQSAEITENSATNITPFPPDTPLALVELWLRFHDEELCQGIDAVFVSNENNFQVWSLVKDEKRYKKFLKLLQRISQSRRVETFAAEPVPSEDSDETNGLPPSLWENDELRALFRVPKRRSDPEEIIIRPLSIISTEEIFKQRLIIFAAQTIEGSENLERYAKDLPALTHLALDLDFDADLRLLALKICRKHAHGLEKQIDKLNKNLKQALPEGKKKQALPLQDIRDSSREASPVELAERISEKAQNVARQVYSFIYPDSHIVELDELRNPGILDSLTVLREMNEIYVQKLGLKHSNFEFASPLKAEPEKAITG